MHRRAGQCREDHGAVPAAPWPEHHHAPHGRQQRGAGQAWEADLRGGRRSFAHFRWHALSNHSQPTPNASLRDASCPPRGLHAPVPAAPRRIACLLCTRLSSLFVRGGSDVYRAVVQVWDLGGQANLRPSWATYYQHTDSIILVRVRVPRCLGAAILCVGVIARLEHRSILNRRWWTVQTVAVWALPGRSSQLF